MRIGVDLGGTKTEAILIDEAGTEIARRRVATKRDDYAATITTIGELAAALEAEAGRRCPIGIGMPGAISPATGLIKNANSTWLNSQPFLDDLKKALGNRVRVANDADCFALSEAMDGAGEDAPSVFGVILGTGVGGGFVVNGGLLSGPNAISGEWGHTPLPWPHDDERPGPACYCGLAGCVETWCSGPGLAADHLRVAGEELAPEAIASGAAEGDAAARQTLARHTDRVARALAVVINILDPHVIVLGGGLSELDHLYDEIPPLLERYVFSDTVRTPIRRNTHGASGGVRGAAWLWGAEEAKAI